MPHLTPDQWEPVNNHRDRDLLLAFLAWPLIPLGVCVVTLFVFILWKLGML